MFGAINGFNGDLNKINRYIDKNYYNEDKQKCATRLLSGLPKAQREQAINALTPKEVDCTGERKLIDDLFIEHSPSNAPKVNFDEMHDYDIPSTIYGYYKGIVDKLRRIASGQEKGTPGLLEDLKNKSLSPNQIDNDAIFSKAGEVVKKTVDSFAELNDSTALIIKRCMEFYSTKSIQELLTKPNNLQKLLSKIIKR